MLAQARQKLDSEIFVSEREMEQGHITVGDIVWLKEAHTQASVLSISEETDKVEVLAGQVRITLSLDNIEKTVTSEHKVPVDTHGQSPWHF